MSIIGSAIGGVVSAVGSIEQSRREEEALKYQQKQAENERFVTQEATAAAVGDIRKQGRLRLGQAVAKTRASGVTLEGSPLQVMSDNAAEAELEAQRAQWAGDLKAMGYTDIVALRKFEARQTKKELFNRAGATLLSSLGNSGAGSSLMSYAASRNSGGV